MKRDQTFYISRNPLEMCTSLIFRLTRLRLNVSHASLVASVLDAISLSMNNRIAEQLVNRACPTLSGLLPLKVERTFRIMLQNIGFGIFLNVFCSFLL